MPVHLKKSTRAIHVASLFLIEPIRGKCDLIRTTSLQTHRYGGGGRVLDHRRRILVQNTANIVLILISMVNHKELQSISHDDLINSMKPQVS